MWRDPPASGDPEASSRWFDALALSAISSLETRLESEMDAHKTCTFEHANWRRASPREERIISCASQRSGSMERTKPEVPAIAAAQKLNRPTLAPTSHTIEPGCTSSSTIP